MRRETTGTKRFLFFGLALFSALIGGAEVIKTSTGFLVKHARPDFTLEIPEGFEKVAPSELPRKNTIYGFRSIDEDSEIYTVIWIETMGGKIGREKIKPETLKKYLPPDAEFHFEQFDSLGFVLDAVISYFAVEEFPIVNYQAEIPLKEQAVLVTITGSKEDSGVIREIFKKILISIKGASNWK